VPAPVTITAEGWTSRAYVRIRWRPRQPDYPTKQAESRAIRPWMPGSYAAKIATGSPYGSTLHSLSRPAKSRSASASVQPVALMYSFRLE
jgi:hypothetical protein